MDVAAAKAGLGQGGGTRRAAAAPPIRHAEAFPGKDEPARDTSRRNFLALVFCLMVGTAALPHILMRYYTTPSVRQARESVFWSLFFIFLLYFTAPALGVLAKFDVYSFVVGSQYANLPRWARRGRPWTRRCCRSSTSTRTASCSSRRSCSAATSSCWRHRRLPVAVRGIGPRRRRRAGGGAVDCRWPAADDRQRALARPLLQDAGPERVHGPPRDDFQAPPRGRRDHCRIRCGPEASGHPVPGVCRVLARGGVLLPGTGPAESSGNARTAGAQRSG